MGLNPTATYALDVKRLKPAVGGFHKAIIDINEKRQRKKTQLRFIQTAREARNLEAVDLGIRH